MNIAGKSVVAVAALSLSLGGASTISADDEPAVAVPAKDAFAPIERYGITYDEPRDIAEFYLRQFGLHRNDADMREIRHPSDRSMRILFVTVDDAKDAQVQGVQWRLGVKFSEGQWQAVEAGLRRKCHKGPNAGEWTKDVCP